MKSCTVRARGTKAHTARPSIDGGRAGIGCRFVHVGLDASAAETDACLVTSHPSTMQPVSLWLASTHEYPPRQGNVSDTCPHWRVRASGPMGTKNGVIIVNDPGASLLRLGLLFAQSRQGFARASRQRRERCGEAWLGRTRCDGTAAPQQGVVTPSHLHEFQSLF